MKKNSTTILISVLGLLLVIYLAMNLLGDKKKSKGLRTEIVEMDTAKVDALTIVGKEETVELKKTDGEWKVRNSLGEFIPTNAGSVKGTLNSLVGIKPSRLVTKRPEKWSEYQVDSTGTMVRAFEGDIKTLDLVVGRFAVKGQRQFYSFVRLAEENEVYAADNFMAMSIPSKANDYRNSSLLRLTKDSVNQIVFNYPLDSGFVLSKADGQWLIDGQPSDSAATADFLSGINFLNGQEFQDNVPSGDAIAKIDILQNSMEMVSVSCYWNGDWEFNSSENQQNFFKSKGIEEKLLKSKSDF